MYLVSKFGREMIRCFLAAAGLVLAAVVSLTAQTLPPPGVISGRVTEKITGQPVPGASIAISTGASVKSDQSGYYELEVPPGSYDTRCTAAGYAPVSLGTLAVTSKYRLVVDVRLSLQVTGEASITGELLSASAELPVSAIALRRQDIRGVPGTGGDVLRLLSSLPGVTSISTQFGDYLVRGGTAGENLTLIDNIPIEDFTYFSDQYDGGKGGRGAILAPDVFDRMEFSAGGFGARYSDRLSSVLDVTLRAANRKRPQGTVFADSGVAGGSLEIPLGPKGGWFFSARRSYIDVALDLFDIGDIGQPRNLDFINKFDFELGTRHKVNINAMNFNDRATLPYSTAVRAADQNEKLVTERSSRRYILGGSLSSTLGSRSFSQLTGWITGNHNDGSYLRLDQSTLQRQRDIREIRAGIKEDFSSALKSNVNLTAGAGISFEQGRLYDFERNGIGYSFEGEEYRAPTRTSLLQLDRRVNAFGYGTLTRTFGGGLELTAGLRVDHYGLTGETLVSPRGSVRYRLARRLSVTGGIGIYRQPPTSFVYSLSANNRSLVSERACHFIGGLQYQVGESARLSVEFYNKEYGKYLVQPTKSSPDRANSGQGYARGVELTALKAFSGWWSGQASYSYTLSKIRLAPELPLVFNEIVRPHQLTLIGMTRFKGVGLAVKVRKASGLAYSKLVLKGSPSLWELNSPGDRNSLRLPSYFQLDLRTEKKFDFHGWSFAPYADLFNVTQHNTVTQVTYRSTAAPSFIGESLIIPIIGARIEF